MINYMKRNSYAIWLGASLAMVDIPLTNFRFWIVMIPTVCFVSFLRK